MLKVTDVGYSHSKAMDTSLSRVIVESVWGEVQQQVYSGFENGHKTQQITTDEGAWFLGQSAIEQSIFQSRRQDRDWVESPEYLAIHLYLISEMTTATNPDIQLVTGLPIGYFADKDKQIKRLKGRHTIKRPGRHTQQITISEVLCLPQGLSAVFSEALDNNGKIRDNDIATGTVGVLDIGGHTVNVSTFKEMRPIGKQTGSIDAGMWTVIKEVGKRINAAYPGQNLHGHEIIEIMKAGHIRQRGRKQDVNGIIFDVVQPFVDRILAEATQVWGEATRLDVLLVAGGGAEVAGQAIEEKHLQARIVEDPQWANALGYLKFGRRQFGV